MYAGAPKLIAPKEWEPLSSTGLPIDYDILPVQADFIFDMAHRFQAYGGGLGNGKSLAGCLKVWNLCHMFPGNMGYMGRLDGKEFRNTTWREFRRLIPDTFIAKQNDQLGYLKFKPQYGGSEIIYGDLKEDRFNNLNLGWFYIDQAEEIDGERFNLLVSRLRRQVPLIGDDDKPIMGVDGKPLFAPTYGVLTFNPEGTNSYIYKNFHPQSAERPCTCSTLSVCKEHDFQLYQASTYDGLKAGFIPQEYVDSMLAVFPPDAKRRYLDGSWDVFSGRVFPQFDMPTHVIDYIKVLPHWKVYESIDHGFTNPTAVQWWARDEYGNDYLADEHYEGDGQSIKYHAEVIKAKRAQFKQPIALTFLDSACWSVNQSRGDHTFAIVDEYNANGIYPVKGQKDWATGYTRICQSLAKDPQHRHPETGEPLAPHVYVASHCTAFIKEVTGYRWKKHRITSQLKNATEEPMDYNDHHMDAWFYYAASRPSSPTVSSTTVRNMSVELADRRNAWSPYTSEASNGSWMSS